MVPILRTEGLTKHFSGVTAVAAVDLNIKEGEFTAVIGPNGAGKTTLFNLISGALRPDSGRVFLAAKEITGWRPHKIVSEGLVRTFQITSVFPQLTALENVLIPCLAATRHHLGFWRPYERETVACGRALRLLHQLGLEDVAERACGTLAHAHQKLVEIAMALATGPKVLLLDEPTAGLTPEETEEMIALLKRAVEEEGVTVLLIEHHMDVVFSVAQRIIVLHQGEVITDGPPSLVKQDPRVREVYLGGTLTRGL